MNKARVIEETKKFARKKLSKDSSGHDWWHTYRVWKVAKRLAKEEKADSFIVEMAALLHDVYDWKFYDLKLAEKKLIKYLKSTDIKLTDQRHILDIIANMSYKGSKFKNEIKTLEGKIVFDADKLDALGAIGVARTITTGAVKGRILYDPEIPISKRVVNFKKHNSHSSIHHFYDKILLLKDLMNTKTAKKIARNRHAFIKLYLENFFAEWEGKQ